MNDTIYIRDIVITPNPVYVNTQVKIEVEIYSLFPSINLFPSSDLYPGEDLFTIYPSENVWPDKDIYPTEGGIDI